MADFFNPSVTVSVEPASQPIRDGPYAESRYRAKKRTPPVKPEPVEELEAEEQGENDPPRQLDLDA